MHIGGLRRSHVLGQPVKPGAIFRKPSPESISLFSAPDALCGATHFGGNFPGVEPEKPVRGILGRLFGVARAETAVFYGTLNLIVVNQSTRRGDGATTQPDCIVVSILSRVPCIFWVHFWMTMAQVS